SVPPRLQTPFMFVTARQGFRASPTGPRDTRGPFLEELAMKNSILALPALCGWLVALMLGGLAPARALAAGADVDPPDCQATYSDFGDAPEGIAAYPSGVLGHFPTCLAATAAGTQEIDCGAAVSTFPGPTGYVLHHELAVASNFWLGCYPGPQ